ncbi:MAG: hypothetical protein LBN35_04085, partial [Clostridiales Family XIII bacterium]|nr:hypothetical protein [Clostridiales Family XIII bacterium]
GWRAIYLKAAHAAGIAGAKAVSTAAVLTVTSVITVSVGATAAIDQVTHREYLREPSPSSAVMEEIGGGSAATSDAEPAPGGEDAGTVNPKRIALSSEEVLTDVSWIIRDNASGEVVYSGTGDEVIAPLAALRAGRAKGVYTLEFTYKGSAGPGTVQETFSISG